MSNVVHHLLAAAWSFALVAGVLTLVAKLWLSRRLDRLSHPAQFDSAAVYIFLVVPGLLPLVWLVSGLVHLEESGALSQACCSLFTVSEATWQHWMFGSGAALLALRQIFSMSRRWRPNHGSHEVSDFDQSSRRVRRICESNPALQPYAEHTFVVDCSNYICATVGLFKRRIEIAESLLDRLDDSALEAALLHEVAHFSVHDPARSFLLLVSQITNPFSWLLSREASAWRFSREIICDNHAIDSGARPVSVADAIVTAAKATSSAPPYACAHLCDGKPDTLTARVQLLLHGDQSRYDAPDAARVPMIGSGILALGLVLPHLLGARVISFHCLLEETLNTLIFLF